jgi:hypothetical protein
MERNDFSSNEMAKALKHREMDKRGENKRTAFFRTNKLPLPVLVVLRRQQHAL